MSLTELRERGRQAAHKQAERLFGFEEGEWSDEQFRRRLAAPFDAEPVERVGRLALEEIAGNRAGRSSPIPSSAWRDHAPILQARFEPACMDLIEQADRAIDGRFDLLGLRDLSFGRPVDWHLEPTSGRRTGRDRHWSEIDYLDPAVAGDKKITWELNRHGHFVILSQAYALTGDERYAETFVAQLLDWLESNPPKLGINWASSLELSLRAIAWLWALPSFASSKAVTPAILWRMLKSLAQQGSSIETYLSYYFAPNTHLTGEALGLVYLGATLPWLKAARRWRELGLAILVDQLKTQVQPDGVYFEHASYYQRYTADFYLHLMLLARRGTMALPGETTKIVCLLLDHLMWITRPDGFSTLYGDEDGGRLLSLHRREAGDFRDTLQLGAVLYGEGTWKWIGGEAGPELLWMLGRDGLDAYDCLEPRKPGGHARHFSAGGFAVFRDGWTPSSSYLFIDGGAHGAVNHVHAHADALSFEYAAGGVTWIVDPGTYAYTRTGPWRDYFRTSPGHNTLVVDGLSQSAPDGPFSWSSVAEARIVRFETNERGGLCEAHQNGYERLVDPVGHRRSFSLLAREGWPERPAVLLIEDRLSAKQRHRCQLRFHLAPDCVPAAQGDEVLISHGSGARLVAGVWRIAPDGQAAALPFSCEEGWVSRCYGKREPAHILTAETASNGDDRFVTLFAAIQAGETVDLRSIMSREIQGERRYAAQV